MNNNESKWDKLLRIKTSGRDDSRADQYRYPYEPTPYSVLESLANAEYIGKKNTIVDYGCGKGRVDFFLSYQTRCKSIGIEILRSVIGRVMESYYEEPREMLLFFYYPSDEYISYLMTVDELAFLDEIDCRDLFDGENPRERIVIFEVAV